jgi:hypothetical protein
VLAPSKRYGVRQLLAGLLISSSAACTGNLQLKGDLAPIARPLSASVGVACTVVVEGDDRQPLQGCYLPVGDTIAYYYYSTLSGQVVAVGRTWQLREVPQATFDSLARAWVEAYGRPSRICDRSDSWWRLSDWRWDGDGKQRILVVAEPSGDAESRAFAQWAVEYKLPDCRSARSLPLPR